MALPLPKVVADVGPGGPMVTSMRGMNALANDMLSNKIKGVEADYAPMTVQAEAASKLAYAKLMGPQFLAKLMGHDPILANMTEAQKKDALNSLYGAGTGQGTGNSLMNMPGHPAQSEGSFGNFLSNKVRGLFGGDQQQPQQQNNALSGRPPIDQSNLSAQDRQGVNALQPGQSNGQQGQGPNSGYAYDAQGNNVVASPQEIVAAANGNSPNAQAQPYRTFSENTANQADIVEEGKELGKARGTAISELGKQYVQDVEAVAPLHRLAELTQSPVFANMRKDIPFFGGLQLQTLAKVGNPEQQRAIGDFIVDTKSAVANTVNSFQGRAMAKEFDFANTMKINDNDTINVMLGKLESLMTFKDATMQRNRIATNLMQKNHMNEGDAYAEANKQVDMNAVRENVANQLSTPIRIKNKKTGETKLVTPKEYNALLNQ